MSRSRTGAERSPVVVAITDPWWPDGHLLRIVGVASRVLPRGALVVQLRDKSGRDFEPFARALLEVVHPSGARLVVNGDVDLAAAIGADGVHLGGERPELSRARAVLGDAAFISVAAHTGDDVTHAARGGATAVLVSPIFETPGKGPPRGVDALREAKERANGALAIVALGGIDARRAAACAAAGATGVAVMRALFDVQTEAEAEATALALFAAFGP